MSPRRVFMCLFSICLLSVRTVWRRVKLCSGPSSHIPGSRTPPSFSSSTRRTCLRRRSCIPTWLTTFQSLMVIFLFPTSTLLDIHNMNLTLTASHCVLVNMQQWIQCQDLVNQISIQVRSWGIGLVLSVKMWPCLFFCVVSFGLVYNSGSKTRFDTV